MEDAIERIKSFNPNPDAFLNLEPYDNISRIGNEQEVETVKHHKILKTILTTVSLLGSIALMGLAVIHQSYLLGLMAVLSSWKDGASIIYESQKAE